MRMIPAAPLQYVWVMFLNLSCPAVSQIWSLIFLSSTWMILVLKSTPIVATQVPLKSPSQNCIRKLVFPTPESPMMIIFTKQSQGSCVLLDFRVINFIALKAGGCSSLFDNTTDGMSERQEDTNQQWLPSEGENLNAGEPLYDYFIRISDLDDVDRLNKLILNEEADKLNLLYAYPNLLRLFEKSFISITILDRTHTVIGAACFNDSPPGLQGKQDYLHENLWEGWLFDAFNTEKIDITSYNTLWMTYMFVNEENKGDYQMVMERVFQNVYSFRPEITGILFLKRGEVGEREGECDVIMAVRNLFLKFKKTKPDVLKQIIGVSTQSEVYYSTKLQVTETMEIRMAREEDHDDLAEIFNNQSEVLTSQFGEFFIADLIATQNLTRRITKGSKSEGKAIVGQVNDKAVGLMSISTQIDYSLLNNCFDLSLFDSLIKSDLMQTISMKRERMEQEQKWAEETEIKVKRALVEEEYVKCTKIGQRVLLQQYCCDKELDIKMEMDSIAANEEQLKTLDRQAFVAMVTKWMAGHSLCFPSQRLLEFPEELKKLETFIISPMEFLLETLEIFGLPKNYMYGNGHWKDWAKKILEDKRTAQLRRPARKQPKKPLNRKGKENKQDQLKPPSSFDLTPFKEAFSRFVSVGAEVRTILREEIIENKKRLLMQFCDKHGEMMHTNSVDLGALAKTMSDLGFEINPSVLENLYSTLEAFGGIRYDESVVQMVVKEEEDPKKKMFLTKKAENEAPKIVDVTLRLTNYALFSESLETIKYFDLKLARLGYLKSPRLQSELQVIVEVDKKQDDALQAQRSIAPDYGNYDVIVTDLSAHTLPEIPYECQNAIVVNLFCIDEVYESRSLEFVDYAFNLFPDRDYIILTQPFEIPESTLLQNFIQVDKKKNSTFEHCLYIFHRDSLLSSGLVIRRSKPEDLPKAEYILSTMHHSQKIKSDIIHSLTQSSSKLVSFTVSCGEEVIGMYVVSKAVNLDYYISHFFVQDNIILDEHPKECHTKLIHAILNPLFSKSVRYILREILRLLNKTCMYFEVHERTLLPDIFHEFILVKARVFPHFLRRKWDVDVGEEDLERRLKVKGAVDDTRNPSDESEPPFSLSMITKKLLRSQKVSNNNRIVVVGASDTGISFIESLLSIKQINFTNITLLAPGGMLSMHVKSQKELLKVMSTSYNLEELKNLMIDARTTVLDSKMVKLDKKNKRIMLDTNAYVPFDILVIAVGLIDTQLQNQGLISCGLVHSPYYKDKKHVKGVYSIDDPYLYREFDLESKNIRLLNRKKKPANITIYGRTPHTISFITGLLERGVDPKRIYFVTPNPSRPRKRTFSSNVERLAYEESLVNDPDSFEDPNVEKIVFQQLISLGVNVNLGFEFHQMVGNPCQSIRFRKKAADYDQLQQQIRNKRVQIQLKLQQMGNKIQDDYESEDSDAEEKISPQQEIQKLQQRQYIELETPCSFFVTSGLIDIDREIFNIIHENGLVYNGRLIIKSNFQTTESEIFACGKICQFSQRYKNYSIGKSLRLDKYNGRQLGCILSKHVLEKLDLGYLTSEKYSEESLPKLYMPVGCGSALPSGLVYYFIRKNDYSQPKVVYQKEKDMGEQYRQIKSDNIVPGVFQGHYIRFMVDNNGLIDSVSYLGSEGVVVQSLMSFVGLSATYLNKLTSRYQHGLITNISEFLSENWAICLYHELFSEFRHYTKNQLLNHPVADRVLNRATEKAKEGENVSEQFFKDIKTIIPEDLISLVREGTVEFIQKNTNHLPMYYLPKSKVKLV